MIQSLCFHDAEVRPGKLLEVLGRAVAEANRNMARRAAGDRAILAAEAAGYTAAAIGRSFGLSRTSVSRVLARDADRRRS